MKYVGIMEVIKGGLDLITLHPQYVMDENKQCRAVLLPMEEMGIIYFKLVKELDHCSR